MATGTPIIGRRAGGLTETVEHGLTGFLVDDLTEAELAVKNVHQLSRHAVRQRVIERFRPSRMADGYERVYRRLLEGRDPSDGSSDEDEAPVGARRPAGGMRVPARRTALPISRATSRSRPTIVAAADDTRIA
jgi:hypothetical protein